MRAEILISTLVVCALAACGQEPFPSGPRTEPETEAPDLTDPPAEDALQNESRFRPNQPRATPT